MSVISRFISKKKLKKYIVILLCAGFILSSLNLGYKNFTVKRDDFFTKEGVTCGGPTVDEAIDVDDVKLMLKNIYEGPLKNEKIVFLTFDDGPSVNTDKIISILNDKGVKATFFVVGERLSLGENKERLLRLYEAGHSIGNHTYSHDFSKIYKNNKVQVGSFLEEVKKTEEVLNELIGERNCENILIRMPGGYGSRKYYHDPNLPELNKKFEEENIKNIDWNSLNGDAEGKPYTKEQMINYVKKTAKGKQYVVVLMHDREGKEKTVEMLPEIIDYFNSEGYIFKRIN